MLGALVRGAAGAHPAEEVKAAIVRGNVAAAPGPDRLGFSFCRTCHDFMAPALAAMYNIILRWPKEGQQANGSDGEWERQEDEDAQKVAAARLPASLYSAWTIFFAKAGDLTRPENWRPITLLNTDYKILVSMLTARLPPPPHAFTRG